MDSLIQFLIKQFWCKKNSHLYMALWHSLPGKIDWVNITCYGCHKELGTFVDVDFVKEYRNIELFENYHIL